MGYTAIVDYNVGNLSSICHALEYIGAPTRITAEEAVLEGADGIVLPGVGAFPDAWSELQQRGLPRFCAVRRNISPSSVFVSVCSC